MIFIINLYIKPRLENLLLNHHRNISPNDNFVLACNNNIYKCANIDASENL